MSVTIEQFRNSPPLSEEILIFESSSVVQALNVSTTTCEGISVGDSLDKLNTIILNIGSEEYIINVLNTIPKAGYYSLVIEPFSISSTADIPTCTLTYLLPGTQEVGFNNSDYNAIISNATDIRTAQAKIYEVDRKSNQAIPSNLDSIISGSANIASIQDSFYTDTGLSRARYEGTETTSADYGGISPSITGTPFEAALYIISSNNNFICSQSLQDRTVELLLFEGSGPTPAVGNRVFRLENNRVIPVSEKKVWVKDNRTIITLNSTGYVAGSITTCSI